MDAAPYYQSAPKPSPDAAHLHHHAMLVETRDSTGSSTPADRPADHPTDQNTATAPDEIESQPITLGLAIRRTRLVGFTLAMLAVIVGCTFWFHHGIAISHFDSRDKNATEQTKLLNDYNSYSGNIATIFATPVELFVTVAVQVIVLRFMADTFTRPDMSWKISGITLLLGAGIGYMISNGFNALNVQLRPQETHTLISGVDLGLDNIVPDLDTKFASAYNRSTPEQSPHNAVTNTILRTVLLQETPTGNGACGLSEFRDGVSTTNGTVDEVESTYLNLGFPQREWQSRILQETLPTSTLRLVVNPTNASINDALNSSALPMNASRAALLFDYAVKIGTFSFPWGTRNSYANQSDIVRRYAKNDSGVHNISDTLPRMYGLVPMDESLDEAAQKAFFVPAVLGAASRLFARANRTKTSDIVMEFSHAQITPAISFDAVTWEVEMDPVLLATHTSPDNATRYTVLDQIKNCPGTSNCLVRKPSYKVVKPMYDPPAQVIAYRVCTDQNGMETTRVNITIRNNTLVGVTGKCSERDDLVRPAILVVSIGKRLVADALQQNVSVSENGTLFTKGDAATVTNLRKIYTLTVGRLGWEYKDLGKQFNAECKLGDAKCLGLELPLSTPLGSATTVTSGRAQRLVIGQGAVFHAQTLLAPVTLRKNYKMTLVSLAEPPEIPDATNFYQTMAGDLLLPHNVGKTSWDVTYAHPQCDFEAERRVMMMRAKHHYMEHSLQTAYTSAMYYIFQSAVVRDTISLSSLRESLAFQHNSQAIAVWVSTPSQNMRLTLGGCFILVAGLFGVVIKSVFFARQEKDALANITQPQTIARVMMDERRYPPLFLHRNVVEKEGVVRVDEFSIAALSLQQQQEEQRLSDARRAQQTLGRAQSLRRGHANAATMV